MDVSVNGTLKHKLRQKYKNWYITRTTEAMKKGKLPDLGTPTLRKMSAKWLAEALSEIKASTVQGGFRRCGILSAFPDIGEDSEGGSSCSSVSSSSSSTPSSSSSTSSTSVLDLDFISLHKNSGEGRLAFECGAAC
eukprot:Sspe_Gene.99900::Locus_73992_Transcript_1_1_Confidence_1.000_Length_419::g.99900::m.99900